MSSILGQFYTRIRGSQEDIASEGLVYILKRSPAARRALTSLIHIETGFQYSDIQFMTQLSGEKRTRPDISGFDSKGREVVILEAKFWASLTENQPVEYLNRLGDNSVLMFICPTLRVRQLYDELRYRLHQSGILFNANDDSHTFILANNTHLLVKTWNGVLGTLRFRLIEENDQLLLSDLDQIVGLCETIDANTFLPFQAEDFAPSNARRINSFYNLVDQVTQELIKRNFANTSKLRASPQKFGYTRFFKSLGMGMSLNVRFEDWENVANTPFWLDIKDDTSGIYWRQTESLKQAIKQLATRESLVLQETRFRDVSIPLFPLLHSTEDVVVRHLADEIIRMTTKSHQSLTSYTEPT